MKLSKSFKEAKEVAKELPRTTYAGVALLFFAAFLYFSHAGNDPRAASVMITNRAQTSGGTGIILRSTSNETEILTNAHVCGVVEQGGVVKARTGVYQVTSYAPSENSDLCIVKVAADLGVDTVLAKNAPAFYDHALVSGHPALYPNVVTEGHVSGRNIIQVLTKIRSCTQEDFDSDRGLLCIFLGGIPVIKSYETVLVTATIMPGSSGSGVYNKNNGLIGVVFAGSSGFGYGWTVPYDQVKAFLTKEYPRIKATHVNQEIDLFGAKEAKKKVDFNLDVIKQKCAVNVNPGLKPYCDIVQRDLLWRQ